MERLTKRLHDGKVVTDCDSCEQKKDKQCTFSECRASLIKRLAAYEGIAEPCGGLDRLREIAEADKDGRCVVLPCKVGDTVYTKNRVLGADNAIHDEICTRRIKGYGGNALNKVWLIVSGDYCNLSIFPSEFGKTVFFTREEAERAMEEMEAKKDGNETSM